jgi:hypothetical protein
MMNSAALAVALQQIERIVGKDSFFKDEETLSYLSQDYFREARQATAAIRPTTRDILAEALAVTRHDRRQHLAGC